MGHFDAQNLANTAWAFSTMSELDEPLFAVLAREAERRVGHFDAQALANTAWAFVTGGEADAPLFAFLARESERRIGLFNTQGLANTAWAFATTCEPTSAMLDPVMLRDAQEAQGAAPEVIYFLTSIQSLAVTNKVASGFALLARTEASEVRTHLADDPFQYFRALLEACRMIVDVDGTSRLQAAVDRLGLIALAPVAAVLVQGSERRCENGVGSEGTSDIE